MFFSFDFWCCSLSPHFGNVLENLSLFQGFQLIPLRCMSTNQTLLQNYMLNHLVSKWVSGWVAG